MRGGLEHWRAGSWRALDVRDVWRDPWGALCAASARKLTGLHFSNGVSSEDAATKLQGAVLFLTSFGLLLIGATGPYVWFKAQEERLVGCILLATSLGFAATLMIAIRIKP